MRMPVSVDFVLALGPEVCSASSSRRLAPIFVQQNISQDEPGDASDAKNSDKGLDARVPTRLASCLRAALRTVQLAAVRIFSRGGWKVRSATPEPSAPSTQESGFWVRKALAKLDSADREILMLREYEQLSYGFRNAAIDGYRNVVNFVIGVATFLISYGPMLVVWTLILLLPGRWAWRRYRN